MAQIQCEETTCSTISETTSCLDDTSITSDLSESLSARLSLKFNNTTGSSVLNTTKINNEAYSLRTKLKHDTPLVKTPQFCSNENRSGSFKVFNDSQYHSEKVLKGQAAVNRYLRSKDFDNEEPFFEKTKPDELFKIFQYMNDRLVVLNVIDKQDEDSNYVDFNENYISGYNSFMLPVTFRNITEIYKYGDISFYLAENIFTTKSYILKVSEVNKENIHSLHQSGHKLLREVEILSKIQHPNICSYYRTWIEYQSLYVQLEDPFGACLNECLSKKFELKDEENHICDSYVLRMISDIYSAIYYLFENEFCIHNDILARNIWIRSNAAEFNVIDTLTCERNRIYISFVLFNFENALTKPSVFKTSQYIYQDFMGLRNVGIKMLFELPDEASIDLSGITAEDINSRTDNVELLSVFKTLSDNI